MNLLQVATPQDRPDLLAAVTEGEQAGLDRAANFRTHEAGYQAIQGTKPQTLAYGLTDSPAGLAAWIVEKFRSWSDCDGDVLGRWSLDRLLDNISIYWLTGTINSSMRLYYEAIGPGRSTRNQHLSVPLGHTVCTRARCSERRARGWRIGSTSSTGPSSRRRRKPLRRHGGAGRVRGRPPGLLPPGGALTTRSLRTWSDGSGRSRRGHGGRHPRGALTGEDLWAPPPAR